MTTVIGLDIGTSAVKAVLVDAATQALVATASRPLGISRPHPLWSEQDPADWWQAALAALAGLRHAAPAAWAGVRAIGLSGQMHGAVLLGAGNEVLRPAILWNDGRCEPECRELSLRVPRIGEIAGVPPVPGFTAPKLLWVARHEPDIWARLRLLLVPKDYVRLRLTGEAATDMSDAAGMLLLDEAARDWSPPLLEAVGLTRLQLPSLHEGPQPTGCLRPDIAAELGLPPSTIVVAGAGDAAAGGIGIGAVDEGDAFLSLGTSGQYFISTEAYRPAPESLVHAFAHGLPGRYMQMAALLNGASALAWAAWVLAPERAAADEAGAIAMLLAEVAAGPDRPSPVIFLPYLSGERTPHNDPHARGVFFGMDGATTRADMTRAVIEGVAFAFAEVQDALAAAGVRASRLGAIGGGARSPLWLQIFADVLERPIETYAGAESGPAFGAARLALVGLGGTIANVCLKPPVHAVIEPDPARVAAYTPSLVRFLRLYPALKSEFRRD
ncbi:MAG: xylulokinase [Hyphomicrobiaceae bacterium]|nr:xylulokinase [Hyphomicrobiaceae bacterium]